MYDINDEIVENVTAKFWRNETASLLKIEGKLKLENLYNFKSENDTHWAYLSKNPKSHHPSWSRLEPIEIDRKTINKIDINMSEYHEFFSFLVAKEEKFKCNNSYFNNTKRYL